MAGLEELLAELDVAPSPSPVLGWAELRRLAAEGLALAPHSRTHALLDRLPPAAVADEIAGSRDDLRRHTGADVPAFAYPGGHVDDGVVRAAHEAGVEVAFTTARGVNASDGDWLRLRRVNVGRRTGVPTLRAQLLPVAGRWLERVG